MSDMSDDNSSEEVSSPPETANDSEPEFSKNSLPEFASDSNLKLFSKCRPRISSDIEPELSCKSEPDMANGDGPELTNDCPQEMVNKSKSESANSQDHSLTAGVKKSHPETDNSQPVTAEKNHPETAQNVQPFMTKNGQSVMANSRKPVTKIRRKQCNPKRVKPSITQEFDHIPMSPFGHAGVECRSSLFSLKSEQSSAPTGFDDEDTSALSTFEEGESDSPAALPYNEVAQKTNLAPFAYGHSSATTPLASEDMISGESSAEGERCNSTPSPFKDEQYSPETWNQMTMYKQRRYNNFLMVERESSTNIKDGILNVDTSTSAKSMAEHNGQTPHVERLGLFDSFNQVPIQVDNADHLVGSDLGMKTIKVYQCIHCNEVFGKRRGWEMHIQMRHNGNFTKITETGLLDLGEKPYRCSLCDKQFCHSWNLTQHMRTHAKMKTFPCSICEKEFSHDCTLKIHMRIHTGEKPFKCAECGREFSLKHNLSVHMRTHTREKPYQCKDCSKAFSHVSALKIHCRIHTGERPYKCDMCDKQFSHSSTLNIHRKTHTGEKPYQCLMCGKCFARDCTLKRHMTIHTRDFENPQREHDSQQPPKKGIKTEVHCETECITP